LSAAGFPLPSEVRAARPPRPGGGDRAAAEPTRAFGRLRLAGRDAQRRVVATNVLSRGWSRVDWPPKWLWLPKVALVATSHSRQLKSDGFVEHPGAYKWPVFADDVCVEISPEPPGKKRPGINAAEVAAR